MTQDLDYDDTPEGDRVLWPKMERNVVADRVKTLRRGKEYQNLRDRFRADCA
jgi:hypothetical protein